MGFNPDNMSILELSGLFSDDNLAFRFVYDADLLGDNSFCMCDGI